jgi:hypothetical protein
MRRRESTHQEAMRVKRLALNQFVIADEIQAANSWQCFLTILGLIKEARMPSKKGGTKCPDYSRPQRS